MRPLSSQEKKATGWSTKLLLLHQSDTVCVVIAEIAPGETLLMDGESIQAPEAISVGHKLARTSLQVGDKVIKYGVPIGSMTVAANAGQHVHTHNMKSDYLPTHSRNREKS